MKDAKQKYWKPFKTIFGLILFIATFMAISSFVDISMLSVGLAIVPGLVWIKQGQFTQELTDNEIKNLKEDELAIYVKELNESRINSLKEQIKLFTPKEVFDKLEKSFDTLKDDIKNNSLQKKDLDKFTESFNKLSEDVQKLSEKSEAPKVGSKAEFKKALTEAVEELKANGKTPSSIQVKTVGTMLDSTNISGQMPQADREAGFNNVVRQTFTIRNGSNVFPISSTLAEWVEQSGIEGSAGMTAEGATKNQGDWDYTVANAKVKKITYFIKISEEMLNDVDGMMGEINGNLAYQIDLLEEGQLITGVGTTIYINGIEKYAQALDLASLSGTIATPNNWDVVAAAVTQIKVNAKAKANRIFMNPVDTFLTIHGTKDTTNDYINPVTVVPNATPGAAPSIFVWGVPVVESDSITAGEFIVADMTKFTIRDKSPLTIEVGRDGNDFTKNLVTIIGEKRLVSYVKANDVEAFVTDTFADGITFLTATS